MKYINTVLLGVALVSLGIFPSTPVKASIAPDQLIKGISYASVYYYGFNGKRYVFPNEKVYRSWYPDFSGVVTVSDAELAAIQIGGNVIYKPGVKLVKITTDPRVYAVDWNGSLRWVSSESLAIELYGLTWATNVDDVPDAFFTNYSIGAAINNTDGYNAADVRSAAGILGISTLTQRLHNLCQTVGDCTTQGFSCSAAYVTRCNWLTGVGGLCACGNPGQL